MKRLYFSYLIGILFAVSCTASWEEKVEISVRNQLNLYPESRLQDLYKNFFQDRFGPGHLIPDTAMAGEYLRSEWASCSTAGNPLLERIGWEGNFYRVSVEVIQRGLVPYPVYLEAFVESANTTPEPSLEAWQEEWNRILFVIERMNLNLPDYETDKAHIRKLIESGKYAVHHSPAFENAYHPHYRIIRKSIYEDKLEKWLRPK
ncbi:MAG: hypothetical protein LBB85_10935 [Dysgonamonadaceae bacterium]|jgi:hypothetical protein|nr:hypothetical protein [Dysgonamonadaceae bacterium]